MTDIDEGYEWLGFATPCQLSYTEWRHCVAPVPLEPKRKGHALDVAIVVGHARAECVRALSGGAHGLAVRPRAGTALVFWTMNTEGVDPASWHNGARVVRGCACSDTATHGVQCA